MYIISPEAYLEIIERGLPLPRSSATGTRIERPPVLVATRSSYNELDISLGIDEGSYNDSHVPFGCKMPTALFIEPAFIAGRGQWLQRETNKDEEIRRKFTPYKHSMFHTPGRGLDSYLQRRWILPCGDSEETEDIDPFDVEEYSPLISSLDVKETPRPNLKYTLDSLPASPDSDGDAALEEFLGDTGIQFFTAQGLRAIIQSEPETETESEESSVNTNPVSLEELNENEIEEVNLFSLSCEG